MFEEAFTRGWHNLIGRWDGPMSVRLLVQPTVAILFAIRAGLSDARQNKSPFLWSWPSDSDSWKERFRQVRKDVGTVFVVALILDSIYQVIVHAGIYTLELLIAATVLAVVPYIVSRGLVTQIAMWSGVGKITVPATANDALSDKPTH